MLTQFKLYMDIETEFFMFIQFLLSNYQSNFFMKVPILVFTAYSNSGYSSTGLFFFTTNGHWYSGS